MRWRIKISEKTGDILADVLGKAGYNLDGDMLSGEPFELLNESGDVFHAARKLGHSVGEIARLIPDLEMGFTPGKVHEYNEDGEEIAVHTNIYGNAAANLALTTYSAAVVISSSTPEEQDEFERKAAEIERNAEVDKAAEFIRATAANPSVLTVMQLLDGKPSPTDLGHVHDFMEDDIGDLSRFAPKSQLRRLNRSINNPKVFGINARHAVSYNPPPPNPMHLPEATQFITEVARKWIKEKAVGKHKHSASGES